MDAFDAREVAGGNFDVYDYMDPAGKYRFIEDLARHIYVRSAFALNSVVGSQDVRAPRAVFLTVPVFILVPFRLLEWKDGKKFHLPGSLLCWVPFSFGSSGLFFLCNESLLAIGLWIFCPDAVFFL